jgi:hypothetical protein
MNTGHTRDVVGQQFSVTGGETSARRLDRRGIRQIEAKALRKLKTRRAAANSGHS